ncbi:MAG: urea transporter [Syntrophothermus sp.]
MIRRLKNLFPSFLTSVLDSYTQIFFSDNRIFAVILVLVSFFDFYAGLAGIFSVIISNLAAYLIGLNRNHIKAGYYGFNSLLVGLGLGIYYQPAAEFYVFLGFASLLTLFITVMAEGVIGKYGLPFMSISFLIGIWLLTLAARQYSHLKISERDIYMINRMYELGGLWLVKIYNDLNNLQLHPAVVIYFRSLGAIFFQHHLFAGVLISIGLLIYSRISFLLSWIGFVSAYLFHIFIGTSITELSYGYIGFNYILTSIAVGGFFLVPSGYSFLWVILLSPLISIIQSSSMELFSIFQLSVYSLPFNVVVLLFLYLLRFRERFFLKPALVTLQQYSPEKNLYAGLNYKERFGRASYFQFALPFFGSWKITQGEDGGITHAGDWKTAWDFEITDEKGRTFSGEGLNREDYYCFNKPVLAPADGVVEEVRDGIADNAISEVNLEDNWGNAVVIRHADMLYSQMGHLKNGSIKVAPGDTVKKGDLVGNCGNSGRSPVPHLHFQFQATAFIGSKTLNYPFGHVILLEDKKFRLKSFGKPGVAELVSNVEKNGPLVKGFHFIPGQKMVFRVSGHGPDKDVHWEIKVDYLNNPFIFCEETGSRAWFRYDGHIHYFTGFEGDRNSLLYLFYLGAWKVLTAFYPGLVIRDTYPLQVLRKKTWLLLQDFVAPFFLFMKADYTLEYVRAEDHFTHSVSMLRSEVKGSIMNRTILSAEYEFTTSEKGLESMIINHKKRTIHVRRIW